MIHVLVVDDEPQLVRAVTLNLAKRGYRVTSASTGAGALNQVATTPPDLLVLDLHMPDGNGFEGIKDTLERFKDTPIVVISGAASAGDVRRVGLEGDRLHALGQRIAVAFNEVGVANGVFAW